MAGDDEQEWIETPEVQDIQTPGWQDDDLIPNGDFLSDDIPDWTEEIVEK